MTICSEILAPSLGILRRDFGWECEPNGAGHASILTGRHFNDSEPVEIHVRVQGDIVTVSDGGLIVARLAEAGFALDDDVHLKLWRDAIYLARLAFDDGLVHLTTSLAELPSAVRRLADGLLGLDALRLVAFPKVGRPRTLADDVEDYLKEVAGSDAVTRSPLVKVGDMAVRPTFRIDAKRGPILLQTAATTGFKQAFEHAYVTFSLLGRGPEAIPVERRLVVLGGSDQTWGPARINMLTDVAYVGLWSNRGPITGFIEGTPPSNRHLGGPRVLGYA